MQLPADLWRYLDEHCRHYGTTVNAVFREAVEVMRLADRLTTSSPAFNQAAAGINRVMDEAQRDDEKPPTVH